VGADHDDDCAGGIASHPRKGREDGAPFSVVLHAPSVGLENADHNDELPAASCPTSRKRREKWGTLLGGAAWMGRPPESTLFCA